MDQLQQSYESVPAERPQGRGADSELAPSLKSSRGAVGNASLHTGAGEQNPNPCWFSAFCSSYPGHSSDSGTLVFTGFFLPEL